MKSSDTSNSTFDNFHGRMDESVCNDYYAKKYEVSISEDSGENTTKDEAFENKEWRLS